LATLSTGDGVGIINNERMTVGLVVDNTVRYITFNVWHDGDEEFSLTENKSYPTMYPVKNNP